MQKWKEWTTAILFGTAAVAISGCSVFGKSGVEEAPYSVVQRDEEVEIRQYDELVVVSTSMGDEGSADSSAFRRLFKYISGENTGAKKIEMTAPVVTDAEAGEGQEISMTAPVLMNRDDAAGSQTMSFVLPKEFTYETAPEPNDPAVTLGRITDLQVAVIRFSGLLNEKNTKKNTVLLERWIEENGYRITGSTKTAGYNPPWTLPPLRRNEVLIPVEKINAS